MKRILATLLAAFLCFGFGTAVQADGVDGPKKPETLYADGFYYVVTDEAAKEAQITGYNKNVLTGTELVIPQEIGGYCVTGFGKEAFAYAHFLSCDLSAFPRLSAQMFYGARIQNVKLSAETKEIPDSCFSASNLHTITLPEGLLHIAAFAFSGTGLRELVLPSTIESFGMLAFKDCTKLETLIFQAPKGENGLHLLGEDGTLPIFEAGRLKKLILPETITYIAPGEFKRVVYTAHGTHVLSADTSNLTIYAPAGSYAQSYASENGIAFSAMDAPYEKEEVQEKQKVILYASIPDHGNLRSAFVDFTEDSTPDFTREGSMIQGRSDGTYNVTVTLAPVGDRKFTSEAQVMEQVLINGSAPIAVTLLEDGGAEVTGFCYNGSGRHADQLYRLGLAKGIGMDESGRPMFDLAATATRAEAVAMLVRLQGNEARAQSYGKTHPFTDVPAWADGYVSLAYDQGLTKGVSETLFDAQSPVSREMFLTFVLRTLGYRDDLDWTEFTWNDPYALAKSAGIWEYAYDDESFLRAEMFNISFSALFAYTRSYGQLYEKLFAFDVFTPEEWKTAIYERDTADSAYKCLRSRTTSELSRFIGADFRDRSPGWYTVLQGVNIGRPSGGVLCLIYNENLHVPESGEKRIYLPLPQADLEGTLAEPDTYAFSEDKKTFRYSCSFAEPLADGETVLREAGTYSYTTDLASGETTLEILPLA
ncbi:MAG: hypothetical protein E7390_09135 [Ruminococcaceae bacterium]|nr:hypothetical protein [Oscillospiraceae bacterium]